LRQGNEFCAEQKEEHHATGKDEPVSNKPEFIFPACLNLVIRFFATSALKLFANFRLFRDCFSGLRHHY